ncbi:MAG: DUF1768 domain-containing protein [Oscillospiraceae bacterium]|nr:DUF1768 domain-containing protein [Oscillospiraceae bacterium]
MNTKKIAVLGGSFNPPTIAHLKLLQSAMSAIDADKGIFLPAPDAYVRRKLAKAGYKNETLSENVRLNMLAAMAEGDSRIEIEDYEMHRTEKGFTYESLEYIQNKNPGAEVYFIMGSDKLHIIPRWHRADEFMRRFFILTASRMGEDIAELISENEFLTAHRESFVPFEAPEDIASISSSEFRRRLRENDQTAKSFIHPEVWNIMNQIGYIPGSSISDFHEERYRFLSNFYETPICFNGLTYTNAEAAFQAQKVLDNEERMRFCSMSAGKAKSWGRKVQLREDWEDVKLELMYGIVKAKFEQNPYIAGRLLETDGLMLIEGNTWGDTYWGVNSKNGEGENHLGKILMRVREELKTIFDAV